MLVSTMATKTVTIEEAQGRLSELVHSTSAGDEVIVAENGEPVAKIVPLPRKLTQRRKWGGYEGKIRMHDDFDEPFPDEFWLGGNP